MFQTLFHRRWSARLLIVSWLPFDALVRPVAADEMRPLPTATVATVAESVDAEPCYFTPPPEVRPFGEDQFAANSLPYYSSFYSLAPAAQAAPGAVGVADGVGSGGASGGGGGSADLAGKLSNPISDLISVPFQTNFDENIGPADEGTQYRMNFQPVVPIKLNEDWNVIVRTIVPLVSQEGIFPGSGTQTGLGDTVQSLFFSPRKPGPSGIIWGVGPVFLYPTATDDLLGTEKFGMGPTFVGLKVTGPWTLGLLANHTWSVAGSDTRADLSATFLQPFVAYNTKTAVTYTVNTETTYDWISEDWSVPVNFQISKLIKLGGQPVSVGGGLRYWAESSDNGPEGLGFRLVMVLLFPK